MIDNATSIRCKDAGGNTSVRKNARPLARNNWSGTLTMPW